MTPCLPVHMIHRRTPRDSTRSSVLALRSQSAVQNALTRCASTSSLSITSFFVGVVVVVVTVGEEVNG